MSTFTEEVMPEVARVAEGNEFIYFCHRVVASAILSAPTIDVMNVEQLEPPLQSHNLCVVISDLAESTYLLAFLTAKAIADAYLHSCTLAPFEVVSTAS